MKYFTKLDINHIIALIFLLLGIIVTYFSPSESILGNLAKIVYLHGALVWVGLILFLIIGIISSLDLLSINSFNTHLISYQEIGTVLWFLSTILGFIVAYLSWGGILWIEPRLLSSTLISILSVLIYYLNTEIKNKIINNVMYILQLLIVFILIIISNRIFHPENSILESDFNIQISFLSLIIIFLFFVLQITRIRSINTN